MTSVLDNPTLKLNKGWEAIDSTSVREAMVDVTGFGPNGHPPALIVDPVSYATYSFQDWRELEVPKKDKFIRLVRGKTMRAPEIIIECGFNKTPPRTIVFCRRNVWKRDSYRCQFCGKRPPQDEVSLDHILPRSRGGISSFPNCVLACMRCNKRKKNRTPREAGMQLIRTVMQNGNLAQIPYEAPIVPRWSPLYALKRKTYPASWRNFLNRKDVDMLYWETELEP